MSIELHRQSEHHADNLPSGLQLDLEYRHVRPAEPRVFVRANRPEFVPAYRVPEKRVDEVAEWDRDLRMLALEGVALMLFLASVDGGGHPVSRVMNAAVLALLVALGGWLAVRWYAFVNRHVGSLLGFVVAGGAPVLLAVVNTALYHLAPGLFRWVVIVPAWFVGIGAAYLLCR